MLKTKHVYTLTLIFSIFIVVQQIQLSAQPEIKVSGKLHTSLKEALKQPDSVTRLRLKRHRYQEIPTEIYKFHRLKELDLSVNKLKKIPVQLYELDSLEVLHLGRNKIQKIDSGISKLRNLKYIDLGMNPIASLPHEIGLLPHLCCLQIWGTEITSLPESLELHSELRWVDMRNILLTNNEKAELSDMLPHVRFYFSEGCNCLK